MRTLDLTSVLKMTFVLSLLISMSCSKDEETSEPVSSVRETRVVTSSYTEWHYFSFEKGWMSELTDFRQSLDWDLAFHRWDVRTNGGASGKGLGGACKLTYTLLSPETWSVNLATLPLVEDALIKTYMNKPNMGADTEGDQRSDEPANTELGKWLTVGMNSIPPTYTMSPSVFIVRTAVGKYAVMKFLNYMDDKAVKGTVSFEYIYPFEIN